MEGLTHSLCDVMTAFMRWVLTTRFRKPAECPFSLTILSSDSLPPYNIADGPEMYTKPMAGGEGAGG